MSELFYWPPTPEAPDADSPEAPVDGDTIAIDGVTEALPTTEAGEPATEAIEVDEAAVVAGGARHTQPRIEQIREAVREGYTTGTKKDPKYTSRFVLVDGKWTTTQINPRVSYVPLPPELQPKTREEKRLVKRMGNAITAESNYRTQELRLLKTVYTDDIGTDDYELKTPRHKVKERLSEMKAHRRAKKIRQLTEAVHGPVQTVEDNPFVVPKSETFKEFSDRRREETRARGYDLKLATSPTSVGVLEGSPAETYPAFLRVVHKGKKDERDRVEIRPVLITGYVGEKDGRRYVSVKGEPVAVPEDQTQAIDPWKEAIEYTAKIAAKPGEPTMSDISMEKMLTGLYFSKALSETIYKALQDKGVIAKVHTGGVGFKILKSPDEIRALLSEED